MGHRIQPVQEAAPHSRVRNKNPFHCLIGVSKSTKIFLFYQVVNHNGQNYSAQCIIEIFRVVDLRLQRTQSVAKLLYCSTASFSLDENFVQDPISLHPQSDLHQLCFSRSKIFGTHINSYEIFCFCNSEDKCNR